MAHSEKAWRFLEQEAAYPDDYKRYYRIAGDVIGALILARIVYYYLPWPGTREPKIPESEDGKHWLCFERDAAMGECGVTARQFDRVVSVLVDKGIIEKKVMARKSVFRLSVFLCLRIEVLSDMVDMDNAAQRDPLPVVDPSVKPYFKKPRRIVHNPGRPRVPKTPSKYRKMALERFGGKCQVCGKDAGDVLLCFHHVAGTVAGGRSRDDNAVDALLNPEEFSLLCDVCHLNAHEGYYGKVTSGG